jgi:hypothetical protein
MKLFNLFKKKVEKKNETLLKKDLSVWTKKKRSKVDLKRKEFVDTVKKRIDELTTDIRAKLNVLEGVSIEGKKEGERVKSIVKENHKNYMTHVNRLIDKLDTIDEEKDIIEELNSVFANFQKKSAASHAKATYLIGKEIGDIQEAIGKFFKGIRVTLKENKSILDESKAIEAIEEKISGFDETKSQITRIEDEIKRNDDKSEKLKQELDEKEKKLNKLANSDFVLEINKQRKELEEKKKDIGREIGELKQLIKFKELSHFFHSFEKPMRTIKDYKENFRSVFHKTGGEDLFVLLKEADLYSNSIMNKVREIVEEKNNVRKITIEESGLEKGALEVKKIKDDIDSLSVDNIVKEKRLQKPIAHLEEISEEIINDLQKINVDLV